MTRRRSRTSQGARRPRRAPPPTRPRPSRPDHETGLKSGPPRGRRREALRRFRRSPPAAADGGHRPSWRTSRPARAASRRR
ncbi:MAG: hypothetical protein DI565_14455 [Ancylobacter novellus]|uniref:Uncharacterized protein n=1 Tax=Ancylobacter novellus TaxID=921 RepID=A0A2W5MJV8_ANCNO|nr:MAG: hypothetical protein DI565_14455 [Ancylobacter novellus]